jgi:hypothetical protein
MDIEQVITAIGGSAVLFGAMAWLARSIITHVLSKDIEKHKINLQAESQKELVRLQSSLQLVEFEHQVLFSQLHERKVNIIGEMYSRLVGLHRSASAFVKYYQSVEEEKKKDYLQQLWNAADRHNDYFDKNRIFFQEELCLKIDDFNDKLSDACSKLAFFFQEAKAIKVSDEQIWEEWNNAMKTMENKVPVIKQLLEQSFREELGVLQQAHKGNA